MATHAPARRTSEQCPSHGQSDGIGNADKVFTYSKLETKAHTRLLRIESVNDGLVNCTLNSVSAEAPGFKDSFDALSYCWGTEPAHHEIKINGHSFAVRPNLLAALKALHRYFSSGAQQGKLVWIDAICIDQTDAEEKAVQVRRMDRIYRSASMVFVWLGPESDNSNIVMSVMLWLELDAQRRQGEMPQSARSALNKVTRQLREKHAVVTGCLEAMAELVQEIGEHRSHTSRLTAELLKGIGDYHAHASRPSIADQSDIRRIFHQLSRQEHLFPRNHLFWKGFMGLVTRPWVTRVWTYQEIVLARRARMLCGDAHVDWNTFNLCRTCFFDTDCASVLYSIDAIPAHFKMADLLQAQGNLNVETIGSRLGSNLMQQISMRYAADPRDYVYGLVGLLEEKTRSKLTIDYTISTPAVYKAAIRTVCARSNGVDQWCKIVQVFSFKPGSGLHGLPTWCPDFGGSGSKGTCSRFNPSVGIPETVAQQAADCRRIEFHGDDHATVAGITLDKVKLAVRTAPQCMDPLDTLRLEGTPETVPAIFKALTHDHNLQWMEEMVEMLLTTDTDHPEQAGSWPEALFGGAASSSASTGETRSKLFADLHAFCKVLQAGNIRSPAEACSKLKIGGEEFLEKLTIAYKTLAANESCYYFVTEGARIGASGSVAGAGSHICFLGGGKWLPLLSPDLKRIVTCGWVDGFMGDALLDVVGKKEMWQDFVLE